jgi:hypothetical protein
MDCLGWYQARNLICLAEPGFCLLLVGWLSRKLRFDTFEREPSRFCLLLRG